MDRKLLLLGLLRRQEMHGYQLHEFIDRNLALCTDLKKPTAYFLLDQMASDGWIKAEQTQEGNRPPKRVFRLTRKGEGAFQRLLRQNLGSHAPVIFENDIGLAFLDQLAPSEALDLLRSQRRTAAARLEEIRATPQHPGSLGLIFTHQERHLELEIAWLDELIADLGKEEQKRDKEKSK